MGAGRATQLEPPSVLRARATQVSAGHEESIPSTNPVVVDTKLTEPGSKPVGTTLPVGGLGGCGTLVVEAVGFDDVAQAAPVTARPPIANMTSRRLRVRTLVTMGLRIPFSTEPKVP